MKIKATFERDKWGQFWIIPAIGIKNLRYYYGYPVFAIGFAWLAWQLIIRVGARKCEEETE